MTQRDIDFLKARAKKYKDILKEQQRLPKPKRDLAAIEDAKKRLAQFDTWLNGEKKVDPKKLITKKEFIEGFKKTFNIDPEATETITIDDIASLRAVWPVIRIKALRGKLEVKAPKKVIHELKRIIKDEVSRQKTDGFR